MEETPDILLVEDSADDAAFFLHALKRAGLPVRVRHAADGVEALACIFGPHSSTEAKVVTRPRLIILDLKMPKVNGLEVLQRLKTNPHSRTIPVVVLSSSHEKLDLAQSYQSGANSYLVKPMDFDDYTELVQALGSYWLKYNQSLKS